MAALRGSRVSGDGGEPAARCVLQPHHPASASSLSCGSSCLNPQIGCDLERPTWAGAVQRHKLILPRTIVLLVVAGHAGIGHGAAPGIPLRPEHPRLAFREIITAMAARRVFGDPLARCLSAAQGRDRHPSTEAASPLRARLSVLESIGSLWMAFRRTV